MRKIGLCLIALAAAMIAGSASAVPIVNNGDWTDWFTFNGAGNATDPQWDLGNITIASGVFGQIDDVGADANGPGVGDQPYDIEHIFWNTDASYLNIGLVTGFNPLTGEASAPGNPDGSGLFQAGDLFLDFDLAIAGYNAAVGLSTPDGRAGDFWFNSTGILPTQTNYYSPGPHTSSDPYRVALSGDGPYLQANPVSVSIGTIDSVGPDRRYFYEISILRSALGAFGTDSTQYLTGGLGLHWTMECGNDFINYTAPSSSFPPPPPFDPVPEPATMMLLGMGVLGIALRSRKPTC